MTDVSKFASPEVADFLNKVPGGSPSTNSSKDGATPTNPGLTSVKAGIEAAVEAAVQPLPVAQSPATAHAAVQAAPPSEPSPDDEVKVVKSLADVMEEIKAESEQVVKYFDEMVNDDLKELDALIVEIEEQEILGAFDDVICLPDIRKYIDRLTNQMYYAQKTVNRLAVKRDVGYDVKEAVSSQGLLTSDGKSDSSRKAQGAVKSQMHQRAANLYNRVHSAGAGRIAAADKKIMTLLAKQRVFENEAMRDGITEASIRKTREQMKRRVPGHQVSSGKEHP